jgi:ABC-type glycerol-3-phosphate transport system substrate-binding protein
MDFYAAELAKCGDVENLDVNVQLLASADAQAQMRLAASSEGASPYDIIHGSNSFIGEMASQGWLLPLNDLIAQYSEQNTLSMIWMLLCMPPLPLATKSTVYLLW